MRKLLNTTLPSLELSDLSDCPTDSTVSPEGHSVPLQPGFASNLINVANLESMYRIKKGFIYLSDASFT